MKVTDIAYEKLLERATQEGNDHFFIALRPNGCAGFEYVFDFADDGVKNGHHDHYTYYKGDIKIIIDSMSYAYLSEVVLDYQVNGLNEEFKFVNPQATAACGCGQSVGF
jgi:iron-sulfur cluster assembly accessory protein